MLQNSILILLSEFRAGESCQSPLAAEHISLPKRTAWAVAMPLAFFLSFFLLFYFIFAWIQCISFKRQIYIEA